jgi:hypothetical protein
MHEAERYSDVEIQHRFQEPITASEEYVSATVLEISTDHVVSAGKALGITLDDSMTKSLSKVIRGPMTLLHGEIASMLVCQGLANFLRPPVF